MKAIRESFDVWYLTYNTFRKPLRPSISWPTRCRLPYVVVQPYGGGPVASTTNGAAAQAGIPAVIAEAGGVGQLDPKAVELHLRGLRQALLHLGMLEGELEGLEPPTMIADFVWVRAGRGGFLRKALVAGDAVLAGHPLGRMHDLWGTPQDEILSPVDGVALFVTTSPAISDDGLIISRRPQTCSTL